MPRPSLLRAIFRINGPARPAMSLREGTVVDVDAQQPMRNIAAYAARHIHGPRAAASTSGRGQLLYIT
ncbi:hypothetical protein ACVWWN_003550 [Mycobacterium sp. URHB0021]